MFNKTCKFIFGVTEITAFPTLNLPEVAFWGRSNVGKSTLINALLGTKKLVKVSSTPGKTAQINFFNLNNHLIMVDMPGYGFAQVSKRDRWQWNNLIYYYLTNRPTLKRVILLLDARIGIKPIDNEAMDLLDDIGKSYVVVLTKADKISKDRISPLQSEIYSKIKKHPAAYPEVFITSGKNKMGIIELQNNIANVVV